MLLAGVHENAVALISAWTHDELAISIFALDACNCHWDTVSISS